MVIIEHRFATSPNAPKRASTPTPPSRDSVPIPPSEQSHVPTPPTDHSHAPIPPPRHSPAPSPPNPTPPSPTPVQEQCNNPVANQTEGSSEGRDSPPPEDASKCEDSPHPPSTEDNSVPEEGIEEELYVPYALIAGEDDDYSYSGSYSESE